MKKIGLYIFDHDCRVLDNPALTQFSQQVDALICVYVLPAPSTFDRQFSQTHASDAQQGYIHQTLSELDENLRLLGQKLLLVQAPIQTVIAHYLKVEHITHVGRSIHSGYYEQQQWQHVQRLYPQLHYFAANSSHLFDLEQLPFTLDELPTSFTPCRKHFEQLDVPAPLATLTHLPAPPKHLANVDFKEIFPPFNGYYSGGEISARDHLNLYFASEAPKSYKETRNELMGDDFSTKFSGFLAHGAISPRQIMASLREYEALNGANESTYWVYFELLWREYFYWYTRKHQSRLFCFSGVRNKSLTTSFYPSRFKQWCEGATPYPLVNALMHELNETGWMSNRGRQIVASCLVNELQLDWRYGAAYFQQRLIDYDVASNWGNWQYIAGVGPDPRGGRHFHISKQTAMYDPHNIFISRWHGDANCQAITQTDMVDWPISEQS
ncbi:deoxyribodipyrimidine photo-lyase [Pseudoalteromonas ulvae UL12]|uniref:DASH family cryptochrome n=1 Tax=Pseudoalteromonas ulvae TaxID=107327 RepID=UPI00186BA3B7|nr:DASH family cryptochrome [Pseudoalteromonas ulvae]MBE0363193.1 deoxyribodipyrimidine photo-lyase [Pseudoalteromonas ulvae UL12]